MPIGNNVTDGTINNMLTQLSVTLRNSMQQIRDLSEWANGQGTGQATLMSVGYGSADAATALNMISYLNTVAEVYYGGAAQPSPFNFDQELSQIWAAQ